ncbi:MAG: hypothetical protein M3Q14_00425 [bacterium]|nr:hypothetical protein [bacterium]
MQEFVQGPEHETEVPSSTSEFIETVYNLIPELEVLVLVSREYVSMVTAAVEYDNQEAGREIMKLDNKASKNQQAGSRALSILIALIEDREELHEIVYEANLKAVNQASLTMRMPARLNDEIKLVIKSGLARSLELWESQTNSIRELRSRYENYDIETQNEIKKRILMPQDAMTDEEIFVQNTLIAGLCCPIKLGEVLEHTPVGQIIEELKSDQLDPLIYKNLASHEIFLKATPSLEALTRYVIKVFGVDFDGNAETQAIDRISRTLKETPGAVQSDLMKTKEKIIKELTANFWEVRLKYGIPNKITSVGHAIEMYIAAKENSFLEAHRFVTPLTVLQEITKKKRANTIKIEEIDSGAVEVKVEINRKVYAPKKLSSRLEFDSGGEMQENSTTNMIQDYADAHMEGPSLKTNLENALKYLETLDLSLGTNVGAKKLHFTATIDGNTCPVYELKPQLGIEKQSRTMRFTRILFALDKQNNIALITVLRRDDKQKYLRNLGVGTARKK